MVNDTTRLLAWTGWRSSRWRTLRRIPVSVRDQWWGVMVPPANPRRPSRWHGGELAEQGTPARRREPETEPPIHTDSGLSDSPGGMGGVGS